ncbi:MAG: hypothetical protein NTW96_22905 [Planctomycetia bacterium]|nr:hypothetical protein [Planctomycetia bacterium]
MQLDNTRIAIRERTFVDVLDLALRVVRWCAGPLAIALAAGIVPTFLLNAYLLSGYEEPDFELGFPIWYMIDVALLMLWEIPLATAPATLYLGQALFEERPSAGRIAGNFVRSLPQLIWYQVVLRVMVLFPPAWLWLFAQRPYLNEVILLERTPLAQKTPANPSTGRRCRTLHAGRGGDLFGRWMAAVTVGALLAASCWGSMYLGGGFLLNEWEPGNGWFTHGFHLALWLVVGLFTVVRFLGYLDLRIRREGWEVELLMRAEGARLSRAIDSGAGE